MPWLTLNYQEQEKKEELSEKFSVSGIPTLILLDADSGDIICKDAREQIQNQDKTGEHFPWKFDQEKTVKRLYFNIISEEILFKVYYISSIDSITRNFIFLIDFILNWRKISSFLLFLRHPNRNRFDKIFIGFFFLILILKLV